MSDERPPRTRKLADLQRRPHDTGDGWVDGPQGRFWGLFGAAGLLVANPEYGVLLQHRAEWSHFGGTWGLPGGARKEGESAEDAALREAGEEAGVPQDAVRVFDRHITDHGYWSYTTVLALAPVAFDPVIADAESQDLAWVRVESVAAYPLHPVFARTWPATLADRVRAELARTAPPCP